MIKNDTRNYLETVHFHDFKTQNFLEKVHLPQDLQTNSTGSSKTKYRAGSAHKSPQDPSKKKLENSRGGSTGRGTWNVDPPSLTHTLSHKYARSTQSQNLANRTLVIA